MGSPMWRLAVSLNYLSEHIFQLHLEHEVEIIVSDWGSEVPIADVLELSEKSARLCHFLEIPRKKTEELQKDSPFAEVFALNAAARRARGEYIARIDQDTLVTSNFIQQFFEAVHRPDQLSFDMKNSYMFASRKQLPFGFVCKQPSIQDLHALIVSQGSYLFIEELTYCYWASAVGILMAHRSIWEASGGYDERLIYYWYMDVDFGTRLTRHYPIVNIGKIFGYEFYHLEHFPVSKSDGSKSRSSHRKRNSEWSRSFDKPNLNPNGPDWGLVRYDFKLRQIDGQPAKEGFGQSTLMINRLYRQQLLFSNSVIYLGKWLIYKIKYLKYLVKVLTKRPIL